MGVLFVIIGRRAATIRRNLGPRGLFRRNLGPKVGIWDIEDQRTEMKAMVAIAWIVSANLGPFWRGIAAAW